MRTLRRTTIAVLAATAALLSVTACNPDDSLSTPASINTEPAAAAPVAATYAPPAPKRQIDPYKADGMWTVPGQIAPGDYQITFRDDSDGTAYYKICATIACKIGTDGFIANDFITAAPSYVTIPAEARYINLRNIILTPAG